MRLQHAGSPDHVTDDKITARIGFDATVTTPEKILQIMEGTEFEPSLGMGVARVYSTPALSVRAATEAASLEPGSRGKGLLDLVAPAGVRFEMLEIDVRESWQEGSPPRRLEIPPLEASSGPRRLEIPFVAPPAATADARLLLEVRYRVEGNSIPGSRSIRKRLEIPVPLKAS